MSTARSFELSRLVRALTLAPDSVVDKLEAQLVALFGEPKRGPSELRLPLCRRQKLALTESCPPTQRALCPQPGWRISLWCACASGPAKTACRTTRPIRCAAVSSP